jgi:hypothetical protein
MLVSPVSGVIKSIDFIEKNKIKLGVYIRGPYDKIQDSHDLFSPFDSYIEQILGRDFTKKGSSYSIHPEKRGSLDIVFRKTHTNFEMLLQVEVGSGYVTHEISLLKNQGDIAKQGEKIGEIIVRPNNSFAWITFPTTSLNLKLYDVIIGGVTKLLT